MATNQKNLLDFEQEFLTNYQKTVFSSGNKTASERADVQRKCLGLTFDHCLAAGVDQATTSYLLEQNFRKYYKVVDEDSSRSDKMAQIIQDIGIIKGPVQLETNIEAIDLKSLVKNRAQSQPTEEDFQEFRQIFHRTKSEEIFGENLDDVPQYAVKNRKMSKSEDFKSALDVLQEQNIKKTLGGRGPRRPLGMRRPVNSKFVSPCLKPNEDKNPNTEIDERLKNIDPKMVDLIRSEIMSVGATITWEDIAGLDFAKDAIQEAVVWPLLRPDIFKGLRRPPKGILLFGPPGTGKTLIGKCVASQSKSTFFSISASSLTSKWVGEGEKMVRALFTVARCHQPSVIFIDEIDSLLCQRSEHEHESSRKIKTEFLVQLDGATCIDEERILLIGATNRPQELDEAARRRFVKRLYIPLPERKARLQLVTNLISSEKHQLTESDLDNIAQLSEGYSGADIRSLCSEAALGPIRSIHFSMIEKIRADEVRPVVMDDFYKAFARVKSSVSAKDLDQYVEWDKTYGAGL